MHDVEILVAQLRFKTGITDGLLRFSVVIEDQPDLIADLEKGFQAAAEAR